MLLSPASRRRSLSDTTGSHLIRGYASSTLDPRISCVAVPGKSIERITVNVSGKKYELTYNRLLKFPRSLLARSRQRAHFYDAQRNEFFFDRNRIAFESIYHFYQTAGEFLRPEQLPEELLMKEMEFFGLTYYLSQHERYSITIENAPLHKKTVIPTNPCQRRIWQVFEYPDSTFVAQALNTFMLLLILFSVILLCIETLPEFGDTNMLRSSRNATNDKPKQGRVNTFSNKRGKEKAEAHDRSTSILEKLFLAEAFCIFFFTLELIIRFMVSPTKLRFFRNVLNMVDLLAVVPFYVTLVVSTTPDAMQSAYVLRVTRLMRILRFAKIYRYCSAIQIFVQTMQECAGDFVMLSFLILTGTIVFASCGYFFEQEIQSNFVSIPAAGWWALVTMTTIGYGDMIPVTLGGKLCGALCVIAGVIIIAPILPIIGSKFTSIQEKARFKNREHAEYYLNQESTESSEQEENESAVDLPSLPSSNPSPRRARSITLQ
ncbi:potassium voltage-gated channel subfamily A member 7-like isoform X1 [Acropora palmata]|uniref:potassium voltage-gated channel subfamily A member 7-like isoform X1 n=1 Tax=Acropora palmata TaxID=6131 RepID=UPI003DA01052